MRRIPRILTCSRPGQCDGYYLPANLPADHPWQARLIPCACTRRRQADQMLVALPPAVRAMTFKTFREDEVNRIALRQAHQFAGDPWSCDRYWLTFIGPNRVGKTHLAAAIVNELLARGEPARFEVVPTLLRELRSGFRDGSFERRFLEAQDAPVLVLDDMGAEQSGRPDATMEVTWSEDMLYELLNHRLLDQMPTVITTNVPPEHLPARIASRLWDERHAMVVDIARRGKH